MLFLWDLIITFAQNYMVISVGNACFERRSKENLKNIILEIVLVTAMMEFALALIGNNITNNLCTTFILFSCLCIFYKNSIKEKFILLCLISLFTLVPIIVIFTLEMMLILEGSLNYKSIIGENGVGKIIYLFCYTWMLIYIRYKNVFIKLYKSIVKMKHITGIGIIGLIVQNALLCFYFYKKYIVFKHNIITYNIIFFSYLITIIIMIIYIIQLKFQRKRILNLNDKLIIKNRELSKIKHDYGAQISYLYGLYLLNRYDELKVELNKIKENNRNALSAVEISNSRIRSISDGMTKILDKGIHIIINEYGEIDNISLSKEELFKVIESVIDCIIENGDRESYILMKTYNSFGKLNIELKNSRKKPIKNFEEDLFCLTFPKIYSSFNEPIYSKMKEIEKLYYDKIKIKCRCGFITGNLKINMIIK